MNLRASKTQDAVIPTASMADVAFLLIIFFLVTFQIEVDKTQVELPKTDIRLEVPEDSAYVSVTESGFIRVSSGDEISVQVPSAEEVFSMASSVVAQNPTKAFVLKADRNVPYRAVDEVIDALKRANVRNVYLLSQQEIRDSAAGGGASGGGGQ
jgi:biopolymer transport protein ExbD